MLGVNNDLRIHHKTQDLKTVNGNPVPCNLPRLHYISVKTIAPNEEGNLRL